MKATTAPLVSMAANVTSITYSYSPSLPRSAGSTWVAASQNFPLATQEESLFLRQGDYWVIRYQGQLAFLKATRGLQCLSLLLRYPGREFHVSELVRQAVDPPQLVERGGNGSRVCQSARLPDAGPILDAQARAEYKRRLDDLRSDLKEAERFNDTGRAERARSEIATLAEQLASAVGLGGRDRRLGSEAERARCAVTKRIRDAINKIGEAIPALRRYLAAQIRTGYFCSYNLSQEHPVAWRFLILLTALCCDTESHIVT